jgi:ubiquinone/menaquinone biosynthesis C-methylase UbiE
MRRRRVDALADLQHPDARSFELVADVYERARPEYPPEAVAWIAEQLVLRAGRTVLDLGAGTGKLTRALVTTGADVIAVEPGEAMLAQLVRAVPAAKALHGAAESIPLADASVDAITAGQSFHWFRHDEAIPELHRVLRSGGSVALVWNTRDQSVQLQRDLSELIEPLFAVKRPGSESWASPLIESDLFEEPEERRFRFSQVLDADMLAERVASISFVAAAPVERRKSLEEQLRQIVAAHGGTVDFPYETIAYVSRKVG